MNPRPITHHDNERVQGKALCARPLLDEFLAEVSELRDRQAAYRASLPTDPPECIKVALQALGPKGDDYPEGFEEAMHLSHALAPMIRHLDTSEPCPERDAVLYVADRICLGLFRAAAGIDHAGEVLANAKRIAK